MSRNSTTWIRLVNFRLTCSCVSNFNHLLSEKLRFDTIESQVFPEFRSFTSRPRLYNMHHPSLAVVYTHHSPYSGSGGDMLLKTVGSLAFVPSQGPSAWHKPNHPSHTLPNANAASPANLDIYQHTYIHPDTCTGLLGKRIGEASNPGPIKAKKRQAPNSAELRLSTRSLGSH